MTDFVEKAFWARERAIEQAKQANAPKCQTCEKTGGKVVSFDGVPGPGYQEARWVCPWCLDALKARAPPEGPKPECLTKQRQSTHVCCEPQPAPMSDEYREYLGTHAGGRDEPAPECIVLGPHPHPGPCVVNAPNPRRKVLEALESIKAAIGDRLLAKGPLSKEYARSVLQKTNEAIALLERL